MPGSESGVTLNQGSGGSTVRTIQVPDTLSKTPDQGYTSVQQEAVVVVDDDGDTNDPSIRDLLTLIFLELQKCSDALYRLAYEEDVTAQNFDDDSDDYDDDSGQLEQNTGV